MKKIRKKSKQRELIYTLVKESKAHPSAIMIYDTLRKKMPTASMGNTYRNLKILVEEKRLNCREYEDGIEHYDAITAPHYHFICTQCNSIHDFDIPEQNQIIKIAQKKTKNTITDHTIQFYGVCEICKNK